MCFKHPGGETYLTSALVRAVRVVKDCIKLSLIARACVAFSDLCKHAGQQSLHDLQRGHTSQ
jgi:hypothetical protein